MPADAPPFDPGAYGDAIAALLTPPRLAGLGIGRPEEARREALERVEFGAEIVDADAAAACRAGLWLLFDFEAKSHAISQDLATPEGSYWHAILHRREPDAFNAKYWFRRVGAHPVVAALAREPDYGSPVGFVDVCERVRGRGGVAERRAQESQWLEWRLLFDYCYRLAVGAKSPQGGG